MYVSASTLLYLDGVFTLTAIRHTNEGKQIPVQVEIGEGTDEAIQGAINKEALRWRLEECDGQEYLLSGDFKAQV